MNRIRHYLTNPKPYIKRAEIIETRYSENNIHFELTVEFVNRGIDTQYNLKDIAEAKRYFDTHFLTEKHNIWRIEGNYKPVITEQPLKKKRGRPFKVKV